MQPSGTPLPFERYPHQGRKGSQFTVRLPVDPRRWAGDTSSRQEVSSAPTPSERVRVLVVDDNRDGADGLAELLQAWGYETRIAYDERSALGVAAEYRPDVVILDIGMPGMNGYETAQQMRQQPSLQVARLIARTGYGQAADRRRAWSAGFNVHLTKPVDPAALREIPAETA